MQTWSMLAAALVLLPLWGAPALAQGEATPPAARPDPLGPSAAVATQVKFLRLLLEAVPPAPPESERDWLLTYFHRSGSDEGLLSTIDGLLAEKRLEAGGDDDLVHFLAAALSRRPGALEKLRGRLAAAGDDGARVALGGIVRAAEQFAPASPDTPRGVDALWAEFRALGERRSLEAVAGVLLLEPTEANEQLVAHAARSFVRNVPVHGNIGFLEESWAKADGRQKTLLRIVLDAVRGLETEAGRHASLGDNMIKEGKAQEGIGEYHMALGRYPAYHQAYTSLGRYYERGGNAALALRHAERALFFAGEDPYCLTNVARLLYRLGRYQEALGYGRRAMESDPSYAAPPYVLGLIHQALQERDEAVRYLQKSLELEPHGTCSGDVRRRLAAMNALPPENPADLLALLRQKRYDEIEARLRQLLETREKDRNGKSLLLIGVEQLGKPPRAAAAFGARHAELQGWLAAKPDSHFALACLGAFFVEYGYFSRGGGYAPSVTAEGWRLFRERLEAGRAHLEKAYDLDPSDPVPPTILIWGLTGLGAGPEEIEKQFARATTADPLLLEVYLNKLVYLLPRWHGSHEEMLAYARRAAAEAPPGSAIPRVLTQAHWLIYGDLSDERQGVSGYFKDPEVWKDVQSVNGRVLRDFPDSTQIRNWYAKAAYHAGQYAVAREQFKIIGEEWYDFCWKNRNAFLEARQRSFAEP